METVPRAEVVEALEKYVRKVVKYPDGPNLVEAQFLVDYLSMRDALDWREDGYVRDVRQDMGPK